MDRRAVPEDNDPRRAHTWLMGAAGFFLEGDFWTLSFEDRVVRVKDAKGTRYIARLLSKQGDEVHVLDVAELDRRHIAPSGREELLDGSARASYKARIERLEDDIAQAEGSGDIVAAERARDERDAIVRELTRAYGLGGRPRRASGDPIERARKAVTERIRTTISHIETVHPPLGSHLRRSVRTGTFCSYAPESPVDWDLEPATTSGSTSDAAIRVLIVDDHPLWRGTLRQVLEHDGFATIVGEASDGAEAVEIARRLPPDVVLMDLHLPGMDGIEATRALMEVCPQAKVLVLSSSDVRTELVQAVAAGASGYLVKTADATEVTDAVRRIAAGEALFAPAVSRAVLAELRDRLPALPEGVVTFLLTDIEDSSRLWDAHPRNMETALERHDAVVAEAVKNNGGVLIRSKGEGDSTFSVFVRASDAVVAAHQIQQAISCEAWPAGIVMRVRAGMHTGEAQARDNDYFGATVNRAARIRALAAGGQVFVSATTASVVAENLPDGTHLVETGMRRLRGIARAEHVFELAGGSEGTAARGPAGNRRRARAVREAGARKTRVVGEP